MSVSDLSYVTSKTLENYDSSPETQLRRAKSHDELAITGVIFLFVSEMDFYLTAGLLIVHSAKVSE